MARPLKITTDRLKKLTPGEIAYAGMEGPSFIMYGEEVKAVLISHDKWKQLNHNLPEVNPEKAVPFYVGEQAYVTIPCEKHIGSVLVPERSTGLEIITQKRSKVDG